MEVLQQNLLIKERSNSDLDRSLQYVQAAIDSSLEAEAKKSAFMCKARYVKDGERNSKYFFGLGKRNYVQKTMYKIRKKDGLLTKDYQEILVEQTDFYQKLYSSNPDIKSKLINNSGIFLCEDDKMRLEEDFCAEELHTALLSMKPNKVCRCDGLSKEFYIKFWGSIKDLLVCMYQSCFTAKKLNPSVRRGLM